jgi:peptidoglycan/LPS O-acetylase OafA/YrhL
MRDLDGGPAWMRSRLMVRLGAWSFAFYLFHFLVLIPVAAALYPDKTIIDFFFEPVTPSYRHVTWVLVVLAGSLLVSWLLYRFYETPLERRLRRVLSPRRQEVAIPDSELGHNPRWTISPRVSAQRHRGWVGELIN